MQTIATVRTGRSLVAAPLFGYARREPRAARPDRCDQGTTVIPESDHSLGEIIPAEAQTPEERDAMVMLDLAQVGQRLARVLGWYERHEDLGMMPGAAFLRQTAKEAHHLAAEMLACAEDIDAYPPTNGLKETRSAPLSHPDRFPLAPRLPASRRVECGAPAPVTPVTCTQRPERWPWRYQQTSIPPARSGDLV
jgi:hypothetical protein